MRSRQPPPWIVRSLRRVRPASLAEVGARVLRIQRQVVHTPDGDFLVDPFSQLANRLESTGRYEPYVADALALVIKPGDLVLDVGANEGYHTVIAARLVGPTGRVIAVEPQQRLHSIIRHNCRLNGVEDRVEIRYEAVTDHVGEAIFHLTPSGNTGASGLYRRTRYRLPVAKVPTIRLCDLVPPGARPVVKLDVEGAELAAIFGSRSLFEDRIVRALKVEEHEAVIGHQGADRLHNFLRDCGYRQNELWTWVVQEAA